MKMSSNVPCQGDPAVLDDPESDGKIQGTQSGYTEQQNPDPREKDAVVEELQKKV